MTTDQYTPIYTREQGEAYLAGWRDRRDRDESKGLAPDTRHANDYFRRGWTEADAAIRLGRNIGQIVDNLPH